MQSREVASILKVASAIVDSAGTLFVAYPIAALACKTAGAAIGVAADLIEGGEIDPAQIARVPSSDELREKMRAHWLDGASSDPTPASSP